MTSYIYPVYDFRISSYFGLRIHPKTGLITQHHGIDFSAKEGTDVMATADGVVLLEGFHGENGYIDEDGKFIIGSGQTATLTVIRAGEEVTLTVTF